MYSEQKQENNTQNIYLIGSIVDRFISTVFDAFKKSRYYSWYHFAIEKYISQKNHFSMENYLLIL